MKIRANLLLLSLAAVILTVLPLFSAIPQGIFFAFDPDAVYIANALSYVKSHQIQYAEHPGTPAIWLIAQSFLPLRFYAKYIIHQPFINWAFLHYDFIFIYSRLFQSLLFGIAVFVFLTAVWRFSRSQLAVVFAWTTLFVFRPVPYFGSIISPETTSMLIVGLWLLILNAFFKNRSPITLLSLSFLAGLALANRSTNISLPLASLGLAMMHFRRQPIYSKLINPIFNALAVFVGFLIGIWPIRDRLFLILKINFEFATRTGAHGSGRQALIDFSIYLANLTTFHLQNPVILPFLLLGLALVGFYFFLKSNKNPPETLFIYTIFFLVFAAFLKFPLFHYELANYLVLLLFVSVFFSTFFKPALLFLGLISLWYLPVSVQAYYREFNQLISQTKALENFIVAHPAQIATVWEWGRARDFAYIWARSWGGGLFDYQFKTYRPDLLELKSDFQKINYNYHDQKPVFDICWDQLYMQQELVPKFLALYPDQLLNYDVIPNTPMALITSAHCLNK